MCTMQKHIAQTSTGRSPARIESGNPRSTGAREALAALRARGSNGRRWAADHGYHWRTVYSVLHVWVGRTDRRPHGGLARQILADLRADLGAELVPDVAYDVVTKEVEQ